MKVKVELPIALLLAAWSVGLIAQENAPSPPTPPPAPAPAEAPPARPRPAPSDDVFIPTEELSAEDQVTFPVDI